MDLPKKLLRTRYRKELWKNAKEILEQIEKVLPIAEIHATGSFTTKKRRPADVDFIIMIRTKRNKKANWSLDLVTAPHNKHGKDLLKDNLLWMKQKYGSKNFTHVVLKQK